MAGDDVVEQVALEGREGGRGFEDVAFGAVVFLRATVGHHDDHRLGFSVGDEVVEEHVGRGETLPLGLVAADAVEQVEHGIFFLRRVTGRRIDVHAAAGADGFGIVFDHLQLAVRDAVALRVPACGRLGKSGFVVGVERDVAARDARFLRACGLRSRGIGEKHRRELAQAAPP